MWRPVPAPDTVSTGRQQNKKRRHGVSIPLSYVCHLHSLLWDDALWWVCVLNRGFFCGMKMIIVDSSLFLDPSWAHCLSLKPCFVKTKVGSNSPTGLLCWVLGSSLTVSCMSLLTLLAPLGMLVPSLWQDRTSVRVPSSITFEAFQTCVSTRKNDHFPVRWRSCLTPFSDSRPQWVSTLLQEAELCAEDLPLKEPGPPCSWLCLLWPRGLLFTLAFLQKLLPEVLFQSPV